MRLIQSNPSVNSQLISINQSVEEECLNDELSDLNTQIEASSESSTLHERPTLIQSSPLETSISPQISENGEEMRLNEGPLTSDNMTQIEVFPDNSSEEDYDRSMGANVLLISILKQPRKSNDVLSVLTIQTMKHAYDSYHDNNPKKIQFFYEYVMDLSDHKTIGVSMYLRSHLKPIDCQ